MFGGSHSGAGLKIEDNQEIPEALLGIGDILVELMERNVLLGKIKDLKC